MKSSFCLLAQSNVYRLHDLSLTEILQSILEMVENKAKEFFPLYKQTLSWLFVLY